MMCEGGKIDWACHANDAAAAITDTKAMDDAVGKAVEFYNCLLYTSKNNERMRGGLGVAKPARPLKLPSRARKEARAWKGEGNRVKEQDKRFGFFRTAYFCGREGISAGDWEDYSIACFLFYKEKNGGIIGDINVNLRS